MLATTMRRYVPLAIIIGGGCRDGSSKIPFIAGKGGIIRHTMSHSAHLYGYPVAVAIGILIGSGHAGLRLQWSSDPATSAASSMVRAGSAPGIAAATPATSSCDVLRETILTGSEAEIFASVNAVLADRTVHDTARQFAKYYTGRDKSNKSRQVKDIPIIEFYCSL